MDQSHPFLSNLWVVISSSFILLPVVVIGMIVALLVIPALITAQRRYGLGQQIYEDAPKAHALKQGTPTMAGLAFIFSAILGALAQIAWVHWRIYPHISASMWSFLMSGIFPLTALVVAVGLIGFVDDFLIVIRRRPLGLRARWKFGLLLAASIGYLWWIWELDPHRSINEQHWFGWSFVLPAWGTWLLTMVAIVGASNAVNLTDGLDGLAAGTALPVLFALVLLPNNLGSNFIVAAVLGAVIVFTFFNRRPARIFMGDTGSLALGALIAGMALQSGQLLVLPILGIVFVVEALSVIAQVISFKSTGKRIFKMSPLHHHFELSGWPESRVVSVFALASLAVSAIVFIATAGIRGFQ